MKKIGIIILFGLLISLGSFYVINNFDQEKDDSEILSYIVNLKKQDLKFYWKNKDGKNYANFKNLKSALEKDNKKLIFAMNGGMYKKDLSPLGLYIENGKIKSKLNTIKKAYGNFYLQPNGVFYLTNNNKAIVCKTTDFKNNGTIKYATQSGPMLLIDGKLHSKLIKGSKNLNIRNGVGILPDGNILFAMSKKKINFFDFAMFFKNKGCKNALYLDGFVSKTYLPLKNWKQLDGGFGVIIAETKNTNSSE